MLPSMYRYGTVIFVGNHIYGFKAIAMIYLVWFLVINFPSTFLGAILKLFSIYVRSSRGFLYNHK